MSLRGLLTYFETCSRGLGLIKQITYPDKQQVLTILFVKQMNQ